MSKNPTSSKYHLNSNLYHQPDSPNVIDANTVELIYDVKRGNPADYVPEHNKYLSGVGYHDKSRAKPRPGVGFAKLYLTFTKTPTVEITDGVKVYEPRSNWITKPLEAHMNYDEPKTKDYLVKWNYNLYKAVKATDFVAGTADLDAEDWWGEAVDQSDTSGTASREYQWGKTTPPDFELKGVKYVWVKIRNMTKPGVEGYLVRQRIVTETSYWDTQEKAETYIYSVDDGTVTDLPAGTGISTPVYSEWLRQSQGWTRQGGWYVGTVIYTEAGYWDGDLYKGGTSVDIAQ